MTETRLPSTDRPTATYPTGRPRPAAQTSPFAGWRGQCPTELLPVVADRRTGRRELRPSHLRAALAGILIAAALLGALQLLALDGIAQARQAALAAARRDAAPTSASTMSGRAAPMSDRAFDARSDVRTDIRQAWVTEDTHAAYDRTDPAASPLDLPRCTTSPDTPLPCLATISPDSTRAVVLEEDASLTALVRR